MIEINLLPDEFRTRRINAGKLPFLKIGLLLVFLFCVVTFYFYVDFLKLDSNLKGLRTDWELLQPEFKILTQLQQELDGRVKIEKEFMEKFVTTQVPLTQILMWLSELLPNTAWLAEVRLERSGNSESLLVRGVVTPSDKKSGIEEIETYLHHLKSNFKNAKLTLTTTREKVSESDATHFVASFLWGAPKDKK